MSYLCYATMLTIEKVHLRSTAGIVTHLRSVDVNLRQEQTGVEGYAIDIVRATHVSKIDRVRRHYA